MLPYLEVAALRWHQYIVLQQEIKHSSRTCCCNPQCQRNGSSNLVLNHADIDIPHVESCCGCRKVAGGSTLMRACLPKWVHLAEPGIPAVKPRFAPLHINHDERKKKPAKSWTYSDQHEFLSRRGTSCCCSAGTIAPVVTSQCKPRTLQFEAVASGDLLLRELLTAGTLFFFSSSLFCLTLFFFLLGACIGLTQTTQSASTTCQRDAALNCRALSAWPTTITEVLKAKASLDDTDPLTELQHRTILMARLLAMAIRARRLAWPLLLG